MYYAFFFHLQNNFFSSQIFYDVLLINTSTNLIIHLNISSLQAHFDELNDFLTRFSNPPSIILLSETRINVNPCININIPGYTFVHLPSPAKAGGVGAYLLTNLIYTEIESLHLQVRDCEDLWFEVEFPGKQNKYIIAVIYRHPCDNTNAFLATLDEKMQFLNTNLAKKALLFGDMNYTGMFLQFLTMSMHVKAMLFLT